MPNEHDKTSGMDESGLKKDKDEEQRRKDMTRRAFLVGTGAAAGGLVIGGVVGYQLAPEAEVVSPASAPPPSMWIGRNLEACTGCKLCEIACSQAKEGKIWPAASRIRVYQYPPCVEFPVTCYQCGADAQCIQACEMNALTLNPENSTIEVDTTKCLRTGQGMGCVACADACPGKTIFFHPQSKAPLFCDLCGGDPECLKVCPSKTIMINGTSMAAVSPDEIGRALGHMYDLPISRKVEG